MNEFKARTIFFLLLVLFICLSVRPQAGSTQTLHVGDHLVKGGLIKPYKNRWKVTLATPSGQTTNAGTWTDEVEIIDFNGRRVLRRTQVKMNPRKPFETIINVVNPKTFAPIMSESKSSDGTFWRRDFDGQSVRGEELEKPGGSSKHFEAKLDVPVFDFFGGMYGLLLRTFPLKERYEITFPCEFQDSSGKETVHWTTARVVNKERIAAGADKTVNAWVVDTEIPAAGTYRFWLAENPPYIIRLVDRKSVV